MRVILDRAQSGIVDGGLRGIIQGGCNASFLCEEICCFYVREFDSDDAGAMAVEYGLIAAGIAVAIFAAAGLLGDNLSSMFTSAGTEHSG